MIFIIELSQFVKLSRQQLVNEQEKVRHIQTRYPEGKLYREVRNGREYFKQSPDRKYLGSASSSIVKNISSRNLLDSADRALTAQIALHDTFLEGYRYYDINNIADSLPLKYRHFDPAIFNTLGTQRLSNLSSAPGPDFRPAHKLITAGNGLQVRSKGEALIVDIYLENKIPFTYEPVLHCPDGSILRPDFQTICRSENRIIYHEHLGKMDDPNYRRQLYHKIEQYSKMELSMDHDYFFTADDPETGTNIPLITKIILAHVN